MFYEDFKDYYTSNHSQLCSTIPDLPKSSCVKTE
jgi:hypothetical protein